MLRTDAIKPAYLLFYVCHAGLPKSCLRHEIISVVAVASHRHHKETLLYQKRPGVFMADWWDADGRRHRKQFATSLQHANMSIARRLWLMPSGPVGR